MIAKGFMFEVSSQSLKQRETEKMERASLNQYLATLGASRE